jgi:hypothetical protein
VTAPVTHLRRRTPARPYARKRNTPPSVTTILDVIGKPGLQHGSAKETATFAVLHPEEWQNLAPDAAIDRLRRHFVGVWSGRAAIGNVVHAVNEAWSWDEDVDLCDVIEKVREKNKSLWAGASSREVADLVGPYVDGLERFWEDCTPTTVQTEEVVRAPEGPCDYIGQRDWVCVIDGERWLLDLKSTANQDAEKGVYADTWRLQLAAYRFAPEVVVYDAQGVETATLPNEPVARCGVVHLRGDGAYQLIELRCDEDAHARFLAARALYQWVQTESKKPAPVVVRPELIVSEGEVA